VKHLKELKAIIANDLDLNHSLPSKVACKVPKNNDLDLKAIIANDLDLKAIIANDLDLKELKVV